MAFSKQTSSGFVSLKNFSHNNRTQGEMEKSQHELKRTRLQSRRFKNLAEIAVVYHQSIRGLIREYEDGFRATKKTKFTKSIKEVNNFMWFK